MIVSIDEIVTKVERKDKSMKENNSLHQVGKKLTYCFMSLVLCMLMMVAITGCGKQKSESGQISAITCVDDLEGKNIGVQIGTTGDIYASDYEGDEAGTKITRFNKGTDAVQALKQGKVDCVIIDEQPALTFINKNSELSILEEEFALEEYAICVAKENKELTSSINQALQNLKENGTLAEIIDNYIGDDTKGKTPYESPKDVVRDRKSVV